MSDHPAGRTVRSESGLTDDDFSPIWADDDRPRIPRVAAEREALSAYLEYYRATVEMKCRGLTPEQVRTQSMPPSTLSLHGLIRHLAGVERWWFQQNFERRDVPFLFCHRRQSQPRLRSALGRRLRRRPGGLARGVCGLPGDRRRSRPRRHRAATGLVRGRRSALAGAPDDHASTPSTAGTSTCFARGSTGGPAHESGGGESNVEPRKRTSAEPPLTDREALLLGRFRPVPTGLGRHSRTPPLVRALPGTAPPRACRAGAIATRSCSTTPMCDCGACRDGLSVRGAIYPSRTRPLGATRVDKS